MQWNAVAPLLVVLIAQYRFGEVSFLDRTFFEESLILNELDPKWFKNIVLDLVNNHKPVDVTKCFN